MSEPTEMEMVVGTDGGVRCIYDEALDLRALGKLQITWVSHVERDAEGLEGLRGAVRWGPFRGRSEALVAERESLRRSSA
jgi:hypothetical protein